jgi:type VI secretion system secreted protein VgrG
MPPPITLTSLIEPNQLLFESMTVSSGLSTLGEMHVSLLSTKVDLKPEDLLGQPLTVNVQLDQAAKRFFHGYVSRFAVSGHTGRHYRYSATVRPWLWFLTRTTDCRIFQEETIPSIVKTVFQDHKIANFEFKLFREREYAKWPYCVQYRESDYNFIARLLENEGIYWYFKHAEGQHKLVLVDSHTAHDKLQDHEVLPYFANAEQVPPDKEYVSTWNFASEVLPGKTALTSYDFERPSVDLKVNEERSRAYELSDYEMFDYEIDYTQAAEGSRLAEDRLEELQARFRTYRGGSNAQRIEVGRRLALRKHPREDQNAEYLVTSVTVHAQVNSYESGSESGGFQCDFSAIPSSQQFRPPRNTPKPFVQGPQTAVVVGPAGEEIFTDKYGRVKLHFHWDRYSKKNDKSSCWVRVSHPWAGKNFGVIDIPRIGQEVVVSFLEGDPDQPLITGRVYNAEQMPPWDLPANATQSGILTRSSKGGGYGNANAIRFEDKQGSEQLWIHAEKNQDIEVENDETHWVGHDRTKTIDHDETTHVKHDRTETVDNNEKISIGVNRSEDVGKNETISIGADRSETVGKNETISITNNRTEDVGDNESVTVGKNRTMDIGENESLTVGKNEMVSIGQNRDETIGKNVKTEVGENRTTSIGKDDKSQVGKKFYLDAGDEITLKTGDASITMKKDGTIQIKGKDITVTGSGKIGVKASGDLVLKGSKIAEN